MAYHAYVGNTVTLKSGGPSMTVEKVGTYRDDPIQCVWFDGAELKRGAFPVETLQIMKRGTHTPGFDDDHPKSN
jgi:uncharacterized protein YodC (DUF2158 family)